MNEKSLEHKIYLKKLSFLYSELPKAVLATLFIGLLLVFVLKDHVPDERLVIWYGLTVLLSVFRFASLFYYKRSQKKVIDPVQHTRLLFFGALMSGLLWGSSSLYIFPDSDDLKLFLIFCIAGLSSGATGSLSYLFKVYASFVFSAVIPFIIVFIFEDSYYALFVSAALVFYLMAVSSTALNINHNYDKTLRLGFENEDLVEELKTKAHLAEQANEAKSMFLSTMSHEIRTPLNAILGYISILRKKETDKEKQHKLEIIDNSSHLLLGVINDILDFNKISSGKLQLERTNCRLKEEMDKLLELFLPLCRKKSIILEHEVIGEMPDCIRTDVLRLKQILTNLLSNAVKFTPEGKKVILRYTYTNQQLRFEVQDEGIGIDEEKQGLIFDSFEQADNSTTRKYGGTGLGLAISYQLSLLFGSRLEVFSRLGEGSCFFFSIDVQECEEIKEKKLVEEVVFDQQKVLVAEDNATNQMLIKLLLNELNLEVELANDGVQAVKQYTDEVALVLMDINMPNMNGTEAMKEIKKKFPDAKIVALTANALSEDENNYLSMGFDDYLSKPIDMDALIKTLRTTLGSE